MAVMLIEAGVAQDARADNDAVSRPSANEDDNLDSNGS